mgnify:FL=1
MELSLQVQQKQILSQKMQQSVEILQMNAVTLSEYIREFAEENPLVEWNEETQREIQDMINEGITSFKLYMTYPAMIVDDGDLYKIIKKLNEYGCFAGVHCENAGAIDALIAEAKKEGRLGPENHPLVRPDIMRQFTAFL